MKNPFRIIAIAFKGRRPSRLSDMRAVADSFWLGKGYAALTFFGHIVTHTRQEAELINSRYDALKNHEMIHLRQAQACHDSWLLFYCRYVGYWLRCRVRQRRIRRIMGSRMPRNIAYLLNPFEMEAYQHMYDLHYLDDKQQGTMAWKHYAKMSIEERIERYLLIT